LYHKLAEAPSKKYEALYRIGGGTEGLWHHTTKPQAY